MLQKEPIPNKTMRTQSKQTCVIKDSLIPNSGSDGVVGQVQVGNLCRQNGFVVDGYDFVVGNVDIRQNRSGKHRTPQRSDLVLSQE